MATFKVWIQIEKIPATADPANVSEPACLGEFTSEKKAREYVDSLPGHDGDDRQYGY